MGALKKKYDSAQKALHTFREILDEPYSDIVRDASIQRFEYTFEISWKTLQAYLKEKEGVIANSPKAVFRETLSIGLLEAEDVETALEMTDDRNMTTHTYVEEVAQHIYRKLPRYCRLITFVLGKISI